MMHSECVLEISAEDKRLLTEHFRNHMGDLTKYKIIPCPCGRGKWIGIEYDCEIDVTYATKHYEQADERLLCHVCQHQRAEDLEKAHRIKDEYKRQKEDIGAEESENWIDMHRYIPEGFKRCVDVARRIDFDVIADELRNKKEFRYARDMPYDNLLNHNSRKHSERVEETFGFYEEMIEFRDSCMLEYEKRIPTIRQHNERVCKSNIELQNRMGADLNEADILLDKWKIWEQ